MSTENHARVARRAFTLVELLVVIGIIAVLVGILLPALSRARDSGTLIKCQANLKQMGVAIQIYAGQNRGVIPYGYAEFNKDLPPLSPGPAAKFRGESNDFSTLIVTALTTKGGVGMVQQNQQNGGGGNAAFAGPRKIFQCPSVMNDPGTITGVTLNHYSCHPRVMPSIHIPDNNYSSPYYPQYLNSSQRPGLRPYPLAKIKRAGEIALIFDGVVFPGADNMNWTTNVCAEAVDGGRFNVPPYMIDSRLAVHATLKADQPIDMKTLTNGTTSVWANADHVENTQNIRFRHGKDTQANVLFADGHVQSFRYKKSDRTTDLLRKNFYVNPLN